MRFARKGFIIVEILIAGLILTSSIAAGMYLFKLGKENLERANDSNVLSSKLPQAMNLLRTVDMSNIDNGGTEDLGDNVTLVWQAKPLEKRVLMISDIESQTALPSDHEVYLYAVDMELYYKTLKRKYTINVFRHKTLRASTEQEF